MREREKKQRTVFKKSFPSIHEVHCEEWKRELHLQKPAESHVHCVPICIMKSQTKKI